MLLLFRLLCLQASGDCDNICEASSYLVAVNKSLCFFFFSIHSNSINDQVDTSGNTESVITGA